MTSFIHFDDILVYSPNTEEHLTYLRITLETLKKHQVFAKKSKYSFGQSKIEYLGQMISQQGVEADSNKIACML